MGEKWSALEVTIQKCVKTAGIKYYYANYPRHNLLFTYLFCKNSSNMLSEDQKEMSQERPAQVCVALPVELWVPSSGHLFLLTSLCHHGQLLS